MPPAVMTIVVLLFGVAAPAHAAPVAPPTPTVTPRVDCEQRHGSTATFWFGYDMASNARAQLLRSGIGTLPTDATNAFVEFSHTGVVDRTENRGQSEFFLPGRHELVFSVTVPRGRRLEWTLATPADASNNGGAAAPVTVSTEGAPRCTRLAGRRSVVVQTDGAPPSIRVAPGPGVVTGGLLTRSSVTFEVGNVRSLCGDGGKPLAPLILWGYDDAVTQASIGVSDAVPRDGFVPLRAADVLRIDTFASDSHYERTWRAERRVADPQRPWTDPATGNSSSGIAATMVLADVYGRCAFGHRIITGSEPMWVTADGFPTLVVAVTDPIAQTTTPLACTLEPGCPFSVVVGPGGVRWR